jgi:asparagine synthase (glutamine-hydrolysing)
VIVRDWHGCKRGYVRGERVATRLRDLVEQPLALDRHGVLAAWGRVLDPYATVVAGVRQLPCRGRDRANVSVWSQCLEVQVAAIARAVRDPVVALGGGLDAAAVLVAWRASGLPMPAVVTLATGLAEYDEVDAALATAHALDVRCEVVWIAPAGLVAAAPEAAIAAEAPFYNLHPVHRLVLARELHERGYATLVTGDGADAVFAGEPDLDYVPIVAALTEHAGLAIASPFFADAIVDTTPIDRTKQLVRAYVGGELASRPKRSRLVPSLDLSPILDRGRITGLAAQLDLVPSDDVGWTTLEHLARSLARP